MNSIAALAHGLGIWFVGEHVENEGVMAMVVEAGIDFAQGYYVGKPFPKAGLQLQARSHRPASPSLA